MLCHAYRGLPALPGHGRSGEPMKSTRKARSGPNPVVLALLPLLLGVILLAGCARVASGPAVTSPAGVKPEPAAAAPEVSPTDEAAAAANEAAAETAAAGDEDVQPAEEV